MLILTRSIGAELEHNNIQENHGSIEMRIFLKQKYGESMSKV